TLTGLSAGGCSVRRTALTLLHRSTVGTTPSWEAGCAAALRARRLEGHVVTRTLNFSVQLLSLYQVFRTVQVCQREPTQRFFSHSPSAKYPQFRSITLVYTTNILVPPRNHTSGENGAARLSQCLRQLP